MNINDTLQQAVQRHQAGELQEAESLYRGILQLQPDQPDANHNLGLLAMQVGQPASGLPYLHKAWQANPFREKFCLTLTECLLHLDRPDDALRLIKNATQHMGISNPRAGWLLQLASDVASGIRPSPSIDQAISSMFKSGQHAALEQRLASELNKYPQWGEGWSALCTTRQILGMDADDALQRALQLMPDETSLHSRRKIFCIGANKTGTQSIRVVFKNLGLIIGNQGHAESLIHDWARQDYRRLIKYCQSAETFQDAPFSFDGTYQAMDQAFPGAKFILSVRNNADEWYESLVRFITKRVGKGRIPTAEDLSQYDYRYPGYTASLLGAGIGGNESRLFDRELYTRLYETRNSNIKKYFDGRADDLLVLNVADPDAMQRLVEFLGFPYTGQKMPHVNSSRD